MCYRIAFQAVGEAVAQCDLQAVREVAVKLLALYGVGLIAALVRHRAVEGNAELAACAGFAFCGFGDCHQGADTEGDGAFALVERVRATVQQYYPDNYYLAGQGVSTYDLMDTITADMVKVNLLAIGAVFLILLLMKRQLLLPIILVLSIETAIWINLALPYFRGQYVFYIAYLIISSVQLGATVDYAILFSDRYQEFRETLGRKEAVAATVSAVTTSVSTTGSAMAVVGFLMGAISTNQLLGQLGNFLGVGSLVSLAIVLSALSGFLYLADPLIIKKKRQPKEA